MNRPHHPASDALPLARDQYSVSIHELAAISGLSGSDIVELVDLGVFKPRGVGPAAWIFPGHCIVVARVARRLRGDFELAVPAIALALAYLERIEELENRLRTLECSQLR